MIVRKLFSAKQVGVLYHYTGLHLAIAILMEGEFQGASRTQETINLGSAGIFLPEKYDFGQNVMPRMQGVSFTRDKNFHKIHRDPDTQVRFVVNGDKISENYKIMPVDYFKGSREKLSYPQYVQNMKDHYIDEKEIQSLDSYVGKWDESEELVVLSQKSPTTNKFYPRIVPVLKIRPGYIISIDIMMGSHDMKSMDPTDINERVEQIKKLAPPGVPVRIVQ